MRRISGSKSKAHHSSTDAHLSSATTMAPRPQGP
jgi:hypothetical protein